MGKRSARMWLIFSKLQVSLSLACVSRTASWMLCQVVARSATLPISRGGDGPPSAGKLGSGELVGRAPGERCVRLAGRHVLAEAVRAEPGSVGSIREAGTSFLLVSGLCSVSGPNPSPARFKRPQESPRADNSHLLGCGEDSRDLTSEALPSPRVP